MNKAKGERGVPLTTNVPFGYLKDPNDKTRWIVDEAAAQVVKRILPPMGNEIITLVKDTSLANTIANKEIIMMAKEYSAKGLIWPLFSTAIFFLVFVGALTLLFGWLEKKLDYFRC